MTSPQRDQGAGEAPRPAPLDLGYRVLDPGATPAEVSASVVDADERWMRVRATRPDPGSPIRIVGEASPDLDHFAAPTPSGWEVTTHGGRRGTGIDAVEWAARGAELGVGEILLNSMDADGTRDGYWQPEDVIQVPPTPGTCACPPSLPSVPTSRATRVTSAANALS